MRLIHLKVHPRNRRAFLFYRKHGYSVTNLEGGKLVMQRDLPQAEPSFTSQVERSGLLAQAGIDLRIKRDDSFPVYGGGNKARKIVPILRSVKRAGHRAIVTNGSVQSNHARATALACAEAGLPCRVVLHHEGNEPDLSTGNLLLMRLAGAHVEFCRLAELSARMDQAVAEWAIQGLNPFYLWGGGHCVEGTLAYFHAAKEAQAQCGDWIPDYVVHSSGSGTTQAGLTAGYAGGPTKVIGVSISRREERGTRVVQDAIRQLEEHLQVPLPPNAVHFRDDWVMGGYEKISTELLAAIDEAGSRGLILDPTYTGKSWFGLIQMLKNREIKRGSKVLFWHTGGLFNLITSPHYSTRTT
jgi:D-cysteine desulfhydrase